MEPDPKRVLSPRQRIVKRLVHYGLSQELLDKSPWPLVYLIRKNKSLIPEIVSIILPTDEDISEVRKLSKKESRDGPRTIKLKELYGESLLWVQWVMFEGEPLACLKNLAEKTAGQRAVCGAVWGQNDLAYRCRTCEHDPTCAICVPCFQNGNHKDHDYSIMYTGGGCCDCGDETAWKREGFCSKHKGTGQIQPLPEELVNSVGPVLDALLECWKDKVISVEHRRRARDSDRSDIRKVADKLSFGVVGMLLEFCNCSESLLRFISVRISFCSGLLDILVRAERFLDKKVVKKLHVLLLKLLGEPLFKYEFAKVFIQYYPTTVNEIIEEGTDSILEKYPLLSTFSVQIFTVPTLTPRLVREVDLLGVLLGCLTALFLSCIAEDGRLQVSKWANIYETTVRLVEDTRYVMSHDEVPIYIAQERPDISRSWLWLLSFVQGIDPQKRATGIHTEEDNDNLLAPFVVGHYLGLAHTFLVGGAFSVSESKAWKDTALCSTNMQGMDDRDTQPCAKVGRLSQISSARSMSGRNEASDCAARHSEVNADKGNCLAVPSSALWLIFECLKAIENCLEQEPGPARRNTLFSLGTSSGSGSNFLTLRKKLLRMRKGTSTSRVDRISLYRVDAHRDQVASRNEHNEMLGSSPNYGEKREVIGPDYEPMDVSDVNDMYPEYSCRSATLDEDGKDVFSLLNLSVWPAIDYDVSSQEISFHIPLHRLLSLLLRKALKHRYGETGILDKANCIYALPSSGQHEFFTQVLRGVQPCGFSAFVMENPLRLRVFCAQVRAGMWRKNGDAAILSSEWYRSVQWLEQGLESDLFLLQCCAALAPPELFIKRIQERFGLSSYTSLNLANHNEYESVLLQEMLSLIIQIVKERRFCGLSPAENLRRELVYKLATGDATHSQLVKALPKDLSKSDQLRNVVDILAVYSNPSGMKQGKYSLREAFWKELDLYHPRWNSRELQVAEERYLRFCKVSALNAQLPRWTAIFEPFSTISRIATSKAVLQIIRAVLFYAFFTEMSSISRAPDGVLITALHLLSLALDICDTQLHCDKQSCKDMSIHAEDLFPILAYAREEFDAGASSEVFWKNQSMLSLLVSLMRKHKEESDNNYAEARHCNISDLIQHLLKKFSRLSANCMDYLKCLAPDVVCHMPHPSLNTAVQNVASTSDVKERKAKARERQAAIMEKMRAEQSKFIASLDSEVNDEPNITNYKQEKSVREVDHVSQESRPVCSLCRDPDSESPLCLLILLQKSRLTSFVDRGPVSWEDADQADMEIQSSGEEGVTDGSGSDPNILVHFVQGADVDFPYGIEPAEVDVSQDDISDTEPTYASDDSCTESELSIEMVENDVYNSIMGEIHNTQFHSHALGGEMNFSTSNAEARSKSTQFHSHALSDESKCSTSYAEARSKKSKATESYVSGDYLASLPRYASNQHQSSQYSLLRAGVSLKSTVPTAKISGFGPRNCDGIHISSCGHAVHLECHDRYLTSLKQRHIRRLGFEGHIVDPEMGELLCPMCRRFANSILPAFPGVSDKLWRQNISSACSPMLTKGILASSDMSDRENCILSLPLALSLLHNTAKTVGQGRFLKVFYGKQSVNVEPALEPAIHKLGVLYYSENYDSSLVSGKLGQSLVLWDTLRYSLISAEIAARGKVKSSFACSLSLESLYGELQSSSGYILSLLLRVAQMARSSSHQDLLLRFRGIQLLTGSICSGVTGDDDSSNSNKRGTFSSILEQADNGQPSPVQFWKRASDPILAHDPFSSLIWVLFCLPFPFISASEFFIPLVHLFYVVSVVQAMLACYSRCTPCFPDCRLNDIVKIIAESDFVREYFVSNYIDSSCHPMDTIRRSTFPYLRRCALLWKMLQSSTLAPPYETSRIWEGLSSSTQNNAPDISNCITVELNGVSELEDMFQIKSLELVLKDKVVYSLALKWCQHFFEEFRIRKCVGALFSTPAVPFKLMQLPRIYQDLLQRYVKQRCSNCKLVPEEPALCLLCGRLCSPNWKSCCRENRCLSHASACGAGIGVFLLVRRTTILLQRSSRQAFWPSPYLDAFGEEDLDMGRGKPLYLSEERYAALTYLVASHGFDRTSEVLRQTTIIANGAD